MYDHSVTCDSTRKWITQAAGMSLALFMEGKVKALTNQRCAFRVDDATREKVEVVLFAVHHHRVSGVIPALRVKPRDRRETGSRQSTYVDVNAGLNESAISRPVPNSDIYMRHFNRLLVAFSHIKPLGECDLSLGQWVGLSSLRHTGYPGLSQSVGQQLLAGCSFGYLSICEPAGNDLSNIY